MKSTGSLRFCPYLRPVMLATIIPAVLWYVAFLLEGTSMGWLVIWLLLAALGLIILWCGWFTCFACSPADSWGKVLRVRLAFWQARRTFGRSYREYFDLAVILPIWMASISAVVFNAFGSVGFAPEAQSSLRDGWWFISAFAAIWLVVFGSALVLSFRINRLRRGTITYCMACGETLIRQVGDRCPECGGEATASHRP